LTEFLPPATPDVLRLFSDTADEMTSLFGISRAEAVARINAKWEGRKFLRKDELMLNQDPYYWALFIFYGREVPGYRDIDRSAWESAPPPPANSPNWTIHPTGQNEK
jgi:hypothetical protein